MGRVPRMFLVGPGSTNHCTWRSHNGTKVLGSDAAREHFLGLLGKYKDRYRIRIQSYCLMGTHPHVLCRADGGLKAFSAFWKIVNQMFARWINEHRETCGQVVRDRMRSPQIQDGVHQLTVMRYGDLNPVRAGLVRRPKEWRWSSYRHYAYGEENPLIDPAPEYLALGRSGPERRKAYQHLFAGKLDDLLLKSQDELVVSAFVGSGEWMKRKVARLLSLRANAAAPPG